jgi:hypothetical protein
LVYRSLDWTGSARIKGGTVEYRNALLEKWMEHPVILGLSEAPDLAPEDMNRLFNEPGWGVNVRGGLSRTASYLLLSYDRIGIAVRTEEGAPQRFIPWSAVLFIQGTVQDDAPH